MRGERKERPVINGGKEAGGRDRRQEGEDAEWRGGRRVEGEEEGTPDQIA